MSSKISGTVSARIPNEDKENIENILNLTHSKMRDVMMDFSRKLKSGEMNLQGGKIIIPVVEESANTLDMSNFLEACEYKGIKPQDAINKAAQMVWRG